MNPQNLLARKQPPQVLALVAGRDGDFALGRRDNHMVVGTINDGGIASDVAVMVHGVMLLGVMLGRSRRAAGSRCRGIRGRGRRSRGGALCKRSRREGKREAGSKKERGFHRLNS
ncbi:MAG TPA: hypothetical protein VGT79_04770, partial [Xanthomonadaceae bacterium]|nr:hypothetical protein [Xanthomonadaceae bacterium]